MVQEGGLIHITTPVPLRVVPPPPPKNQMTLRLHEHSGGYAGAQGLTNQPEICFRLFRSFHFMAITNLVTEKE